MYLYEVLFQFFFFNDTATTEIYTLSLHDALPISASVVYTFGVTRMQLNSLCTIGVTRIRCLSQRKATSLFTSSPSTETLASPHDCAGSYGVRILTPGLCSSRFAQRWNR